VTGNQVRIKVPLTQTSNLTVKVYTVGFRKVEEQTFDQVPVGADLLLELRDQQGGNLANGLYYVVIQAQGNRWVTKLLVVR
jgi:hypothetical protein